MKNSIALENTPLSQNLVRGSAVRSILLILVCGVAIFSQTQVSATADDKTITVDDAPEMEVVAFGKSVIVKKEAKGAFAFGGDVIIEGRVTGDVATIGGSIIQKEGAYIGGDVIVFGGSYRPESQNPLREPGKQTVMIGVFEEELRNLAQNPSQIFSPEFSWGFLAQRLLVALFWFVISIAFTTIAPGAVSRAVARIQLTTLKVTALGSAGFLFAAVGIVLSLTILPDFLSVTLGLMGIALLLLGYVFGRVALQVSFGKLIQKHILAENNRSETLATLLGVLIWTILLSLPYLWLLALFAVFSMGIGLILTARSSRSRQNA